MAYHEFDAKVDELLPLRDVVYKKLRRAILLEELKAGERLTEIHLADKLGVSRTPIRESLQLLEVRGFVQMFPGKATQVTEVDRETISDLLPPLAALQALSAELSIQNLTDNIIKKLRDTNKRFARAVEKEDYFQALKIDEKFHQIIVDTAENPYISSMLVSLQAHVRRLFFHNSIILTSQSITEHEQIIDLMSARDGEQVTKVMRENWLRAIEEFHSVKRVNS